MTEAEEEAAAVAVAGNQPNIDADEGVRSVRPGRFLGMGSTLEFIGGDAYKL